MKPDTAKARYVICILGSGGRGKHITLCFVQKVEIILATPEYGAVERATTKDIDIDSRISYNSFPACPGSKSSHKTASPLLIDKSTSAP